MDPDEFMRLRRRTYFLEDAASTIRADPNNLLKQIRNLKREIKEMERELKNLEDV